MLFRSQKNDYEDLKAEVRYLISMEQGNEDPKQ